MCSTRGREEWGGSARKRVRGIHEKDTTGWMFQKSVAIIRRSDGRAAFFDMSAWILICLSSIMNQPPIIDAIRYNLTLFAMIENKVFWIQLLSQTGLPAYMCGIQRLIWMLYKNAESKMIFLLILVLIIFVVIIKNMYILRCTRLHRVPILTFPCARLRKLAQSNGGKYYQF